MKNMIFSFNKSMSLYLPKVTGIRPKLKIMMMRYSALEGLQNFHRAVLGYSGIAVRYHKLDGINNKNLLFCNYGAQQFKIKMSAGLVSYETSLSVFQMATFALCLLVAFPLCSHGMKGYLCLFFFLQGHKSCGIRFLLS